MDHLPDINTDDKRVLPAFLYCHFSRAINRYKQMLEQSEPPNTLDYIAWLTRNLLELRIWVEYCSQSEQHSTGFFEDAARDINDLNRISGPFEQRNMEMLGQINRIIDDSKPLHKFKDVSEAAKEVGLADEFRLHNKILSKLVHPTAMMIVGFQPTQTPEASEKLWNLVLHMGTELATEAIKKLDSSLLHDSYRKYEHTIEKVMAETHEGKRPF